MVCSIMLDVINLFHKMKKFPLVSNKSKNKITDSYYQISGLDDFETKALADKRTKY